MRTMKNPKSKDKGINFLLEEKKLINNEKLEIIRTNKQTLGILIPLIGIALSQSRNAPEVFVIVPFLIVAFLHFLLATLNTLNVVYGYMEAIEEVLVSKDNAQFPFYQMSFGKWMTNWGINITKGQGFTLNPHYAYGISFAIVILSAYVYCVFNGYHYIEGSGHIFFARFFVFLSSLMLLFLFITVATYAVRFREVKAYAKAHTIQK